ncbi:MAG: hypothetical protein V9E94_07935 [Microthrixaceae bacterium]
MSAADALVEPWFPCPESHREWAELSAQAPQLAATMRRYLVQLTTFLAPRSVDAADQHAAPVRPLAHHQHRRHRRRRHHPDPHRGLQGVARRPTRHSRARPSPRTPSANGSA